MNPNYVIFVKHDKLTNLVGRSIDHLEEVMWLSPIIIVLKKNVDFSKLNDTTKKNSHLLPFMDEVLNIVASHETYSCFDDFS